MKDHQPKKNDNSLAVGLQGRVNNSTVHRAGKHDMGRNLVIIHFKYSENSGKSPDLCPNLMISQSKSHEISIKSHEISIKSQEISIQISKDLGASLMRSQTKSRENSSISHEISTQIS